MKLISCYIDNFGGLQDFSLEFDSGITVVNEPNGFGKTTLATFIRTMFYGFPKATKTMGKNDRKKYLPWQSGTFGGNIVFEHKGEKYRVERTFGSAPKNDTFTLYKLDPQRKCEDFSDQLGLEIFGLDADSFERSTYMPQMREDNSFATAGIQAKLGNLVEDTNDINNFDAAVERLKKARGKLIAYRGTTGAVYDAQRKIADIELKIREISAKKAQLSAAIQQEKHLENEIDECNNRVKKVRDELSAAYSAEVRVQLENQHQKLLQEKKDIEQKLSIYKDGLDSLPTEQEFKLCREKIEKITADKVLIGGLYSDVKNEELLEDLPTAEEVEKNREKLFRADDLRRRSANYSATDKPKKNTSVPFFASGIGLVIVAVVLFVLNNYAIGAIAAAVGAVMLIGGVYFGIRNMVSSQLVTVDKTETEKMQKLEDEVRTFALKYDVQNENLFDALSVLKQRLDKAQKQSETLSKIATIEESLSENTNFVFEFLSRYVEDLKDTDLAEAFDRLYLKTRQDIMAHSDLLDRKAKNDEELKRFVEENQEKLDLPLSEQTTDAHTLKLQENQLVVVLNEKNQALSQLRSAIRSLRDETDILPELEDEKLRLEQLKERYASNSTVLDKTVEFLTNARESLSMSYLGGVKEHFIGYMKQLSEETGDTLFVNQDLEVTLERRGIARELAYFSAGYSDIVTLCMRFALVDALFPDTKPFIILDDPFINLDDVNTEKAIELLKKLGEDRQIIYLVCNSSRSI